MSGLFHDIVNSYSFFLRYQHHLGAWNSLVTKAPTWARLHQKALFNLVMYVLYSPPDIVANCSYHRTQSNKAFLAETGAEELANIDTDSLEAAALAQETEEAEAEAVGVQA